MNKDQLVFIAAAFVIIAVITAAAQFKWLPGGKVGATLIFIAGCGAVLSLRLAGVPPAWFAGGWSGFGMALFFLLSGYVTHAGDERNFGLPLLLGMGLTLLGANAVQFVAKHL